MSTLGIGRSDINYHIKAQLVRRKLAKLDATNGGAPQRKAAENYPRAP
jgi:hypothetical protein